MKKAQYLTLVLIVAAILSRFIPHPFNFTAIGASALLAGFALKLDYRAFLVPLLALWISDIFINNFIYAASYDGFVWFTTGALWIYGSFALIVLLGSGISKVSVKSVGLRAVLSAVIFFLITNAAVWFANPMYTQDAAGLTSAYLMGLPFFLNDVLGTLLYSLLLFGLYESYLARNMKEARIKH
jgi:hypothetical protein